MDNSSENVSGDLEYVEWTEEAYRSAAETGVFSSGLHPCRSY